MIRFRNRFRRIQVLTLGILVGFSFLFASSADAVGYKNRKRPANRNTPQHEASYDFSYSGGTATQYTERISRHSGKFDSGSITGASQSGRTIATSNDKSAISYRERISRHSGKFVSGSTGSYQSGGIAVQSRRSRMVSYIERVDAHSGKFRGRVNED